MLTWRPGVGNCLTLQGFSLGNYLVADNVLPVGLARIGGYLALAAVETSLEGGPSGSGQASPAAFRRPTVSATVEQETPVARATWRLDRPASSLRRRIPFVFRMDTLL